MILGQSAATAASLAIDGGLAVQDVPYEKLKKHLLDDGQVLYYDGPIAGGKGKPVSQLEGIVVDDERIETKGSWKPSSTNGPFVGFGYRHDENQNKGELEATFTAKIGESGNYRIRISYPKNNNRATNVPVTVKSASGTKSVTLNQREVASNDPFHEIGTFALKEGETASVTISNEGTDGYVIIDAVQWLKVE